ncbi:MAG TPA: PilZ domain-containing protein [Allosphingosinicella sp.]|nr:PilZ domain-containing protein [Allosphingosinicella sp.]
MSEDQLFGACLVKLSGLANNILSAFTGGDGDAGPTERREEPRCAFPHKIIIRQRKALGIMHLRNISRTGASGITDMPLAIGSLVFLELKRPHFYAAEVIWANNLRIGLALAKPLKPEMLERLDPGAAKDAPAV